MGQQRVSRWVGGGCSDPGVMTGKRQLCVVIPCKGALGIAQVNTQIPSDFPSLSGSSAKKMLKHTACVLIGRAEALAGGLEGLSKWEISLPDFFFVVV